MRFFGGRKYDRASDAPACKCKFRRPATRPLSACACLDGLGFVDQLGAEGKADLEVPVLRQTRARGYQVAHDHVLLEALEQVHLPERGRVREDARRLLERGGREEALRLERGLGDPEEDGLGFRRLAARLLDPAVVGKEGRAVHLLAPEVLAVARVGDPDFAQHLADDDLDVLVVDGDALEAVHLLDLADQELVERGRPEYLQDLVRIRGALGQVLALVDDVARLHDDMLAGGDKVLLLLLGLLVLDDELALAADRALEGHDAVYAGHLGRLLGAPGLKQLGDAREAARDVLGLGGLAGGLGEEGAGRDRVALVDGDLGADGDGVGREGLVPRVADLDLGIQVLLVLDDDGRDAPRRLVELALDGDARDHVLEDEGAALLGEDRDVVRVPDREDRALGDLLAVADVQEGADDDVVALELLALLVEDQDRAGLVEDDVAALGGLHEPQAAVLDHADGLDADLGRLEPARRDAADVERAHRQLGAGLADRLGGDDAD